METLIKNMVKVVKYESFWAVNSPLDLAVSVYAWGKDIELHYSIYTPAVLWNYAIEVQFFCTGGQTSVLVPAVQPQDPTAPVPRGKVCGCPQSGHSGSSIKSTYYFISNIK